MYNAGTLHLAMIGTKFTFFVLAYMNYGWDFLLCYFCLLQIPSCWFWSKIFVMLHCFTICCKQPHVFSKNLATSSTTSSLFAHIFVSQFVLLLLPPSTTEQTAIVPYAHEKNNKDNDNLNLTLSS